MRVSPIICLLAAVGAGGAAPAAEAPLCKLFTQNEAAASVGGSVDEGQDSLVPGSTGCTWADASAGHKLSVSLFPAGETAPEFPGQVSPLK